MSWERFQEINKVPAIYRECCLENLNQHRKAAEQFIMRPSPLLLSGECGTGKTYFIYTLIRGLLTQGRWPLAEIKFCSAKNLSDQIEEELRTFGTTWYEIQKCVEVGILFIDDFGVQATGERMERDFYEICDKRLSNLYPTIFSTNLTEQEIQKIFGARIYSRLKQCYKISFTGKDQRSS
jgi:DNA replication protein DnaC